MTTRATRPAHKRESLADCPLGAQVRYENGRTYELTCWLSGHAMGREVFANKDWIGRDRGDLVELPDSVEEFLE